MRQVWPRRLLAGLVICTLLVAATGGIATATAPPVVSQAATGGPTDTAAFGPPVAATNTSDVEFDTVILDVRVAEDGSARWRVAYQTQLDDENTTGAFESLQTDIAANATPYANRFESRMQATVADAENSTDREMAVTEVTVQARTEALPQQTGVVEYGFTWSGFAAADGDRLRLGDAIAGLYLDQGTTLLLRWPADGFTIGSVRPEPTTTRADAVVWRGPTTFGDDEPRLVLDATTPTATPEPQNGRAGPDTTATPTTGDGGGDTGGGIPLALVGGALLVVALAAAGWWVREQASADGDDTASASPTPPDELLSNEERLLQTLEEHGGRMKQQEAADMLDWTDAKTSQVVSELRDTEQIETFRLGRENVIALPEETFDEE
jgi:hypothetical protein